MALYTFAAGVDTSLSTHLNDSFKAVTGNIFLPGVIIDGKTGSCTLASTFGAMYLYGEARPTGVAINDTIYWSNVYIGGGTYTLNYMCIKKNDNGIVDILIDGSSTGTSFDLYDATGGTANQTFTKTGVSITGGLHTVSIKVTSKNDSSSAYGICCQYLQLLKTA
jgi:hypothetical protein